MIISGFELGSVYSVQIKFLRPFGVIVECEHGEGWIHISELDNKRISRISDEFHLGDEFLVKCIAIDDRGRVRFSRRAIVCAESGISYEPSVYRPKIKNNNRYRSSSRSRARASYHENKIDGTHAVGASAACDGSFDKESSVNATNCAQNKQKNKYKNRYISHNHRAKQQHSAHDAYKSGDIVFGEDSEYASFSSRRRTDRCRSYAHHISGKKRMYRAHASTGTKRRHRVPMLSAYGGKQSKMDMSSEGEDIVQIGRNNRHAGNAHMSAIAYRSKNKFSDRGKHTFPRRGKKLNRWKAN